MSKKRVIFLKILIFEFSRFFPELILIFMNFNSIKNGKNRVIFPQEPRADMARHGTHANATWHTRPRSSATRTHKRWCGADVAWTSGGPTRVHEDAWVAPRGKRVFGLSDDGPTG